MTRSFGIYVHWPFCRSKCPYCDFNSHVRERLDEAAWRSALLSELDHYAALTPGRTVTSVFFGGGTPSLMDPASTQAVIDRIAARWTMADDVEITLEANPNSAEVARFAGFRSAGINRLSLGIQALDDASLRFLGRAHNAGEARTAIDAAAQVFDRYSFDLIYARPNQTLAEWESELREALSLAASHLSVYQLTIEPGTAFHAAHARGDFVLPVPELAADLFETTHAILDKAGMPLYEVSNHARPGRECRHNLVYWRYEDYVGVGPGAHGRITVDGAKLATRQERAPETWIARVNESGHATAEERSTSPDEAAREALLMGLRLAEGIDAVRFRRETGIELSQAIDAARLPALVNAGLVEWDQQTLRATPDGLRVLNSLIAELAA